MTVNFKSYRRVLADGRLLQPARLLVVGGATFVIYFVVQFLLERANVGGGLNRSTQHFILGGKDQL